MRDKKILILGGSGFLGNAIAAKLGVSATIGDVVSPVNNSTNNFIKIDLLSDKQTIEVLGCFDVVINCTGQISYPFSNCYELNTKGIRNIVDAINKSENTKLIHISTVAVYGSAETANENSTLNPETPYAVAKACAEFVIKDLSHDKYCIIRIPNLYGKQQKKGVFAYFKKSLQTDKNLNFEHDGSLLRYYLYIDDVVAAVIRAVELDLKGLFNLTSSDRFTISELIGMIEMYHNVKFNLHLGSNRPLENIQTLDGSAFTSQTGFMPSFTIQDYIKIMLN